MNEKEWVVIHRYHWRGRPDSVVCVEQTSILGWKHVNYRWSDVDAKLLVLV